MRIFLFLTLVGFFCSELRAQDPIVPGSRAEEIENEQAAKAQHLNPDLPDVAAMRAKKIQNTAKKLFTGTPVHLQLCRLPMGTT